jgi:hypothetical protein
MKVVDVLSKSARLEAKKSLVEAATNSYMALERLSEVVCTMLGLRRDSPDFTKLKPQPLALV